MTATPNFTFAGGEFSKQLWGRVDLQKYAAAVKFAENVHVGVEGGLFKRVGQYYVGKPKFNNSKAKLVSWRIADDDSYVLVFGHQYIRFIRLGGFVMYPAGPFIPDPDSDAVNVDGFLEVATPYTGAECRELKFTFANDLCYIFHKDHAPMVLTRIGLYDWSLDTRSFNPNASAPTGLAATWQAYTTSTDVWADRTWPSGDISGYQPVRTVYQYKISATMSDGLETAVSAAVTVDADLGNAYTRNRITWTAKAGAIKYTIYKGNNGLFGFIGYVDAPGTEFIDKNFAPSYDVVPVRPFEGFGSGQYPRAGEFYKQRMVYGGTKSETQKFWMSRPLFFNDLTGSLPTQPDDAIIATLVGNQRHTIQHMVQLKKFLIFTDSAEWILGTANNEAMAPDTVDPTIETSYGSDAFLSPLPIGDRILFVQNITRAVLDMGYEFSTNAYKADDLGRLSRHLFEEKNIISWAYSLHPNNALWTVCSDGSLPTMTYARDNEIWGWTHMTTQGNYLDVACVPEINQNATYFQVLRTIAGVPTICIERSEITYTKRIEDMFYVDCGLTYKAELNFTVGSRIDASHYKFTRASHGLVVGDEILIETTLFRERFIVETIVGNVITSVLKYPHNDLPTAPVSIGYFYLCKSRIGGFTHLANQTGLIALGDGSVIENLTVGADGFVDLPYKVGRLHLGFPYSADIETLNLDPQELSGRYHIRSINEIKIRLKDSRGIFVGSSNAPEDPVEIGSRENENYDSPAELLNGVYTLSSYINWTNEAGVKVHMPYPLPANIQNIIPDITYEG